jgi:hypothetical protein
MTRTSVHTGTTDGWIASATAIAPAVFVFGIWIACRRVLVRSRIVATAKVNAPGGRADGYLLVGVAREWVGSFTVEEAGSTIERIFGVATYSMPKELEPLLDP